MRAERLVAGGAALSRRDDGRIVLVDDALPGELVEVTIGRRHGADRGTVVRIVESSPDRIAPRCPHVADGCGGCDLAALEHHAQVEAKRELVTDSLRRLGRWHEPVVSTGPALDPWGFRTTMRLAVTNGRAGLRRAASNDIVELDHCLVAHPRLDELIVEGRFPDRHRGDAPGRGRDRRTPRPGGPRTHGRVAPGRRAGRRRRRARGERREQRRVDPRRRRGPALAHLRRVVLPDPRRRRGRAGRRRARDGRRRARPRERHARRRVQRRRALRRRFARRTRRLARGHRRERPLVGGRRARQPRGPRRARDRDDGRDDCAHRAPTWSSPIRPVPGSDARPQRCSRRRARIASCS